MNLQRQGCRTPGDAPCRLTAQQRPGRRFLRAPGLNPTTFCTSSYQKDEENRRLEEKRRAEEERQRLERERRERELQEAAGREQRYKARSNEIEAQK